MGLYMKSSWLDNIIKLRVILSSRSILATCDYVTTWNILKWFCGHRQIYFTEICTSLLQVDYSVIASQAGATLNNLMSHAQELVAKLRSLQFDLREFVCLKFLVLFSLGK